VEKDRLAKGNTKSFTSGFQHVVTSSDKGLVAQMVLEKWKCC
jgi:hypothetical protein